MASTNSNGSSCLIKYLRILVLLLFSTVSSACDPCHPQAPPPALPPAALSCPRDALKLGACIDLLGLVNLPIGSPPSDKCCALVAGLVDLEVAACLCTAIKANVLGINLDVPVALSLLLSACSKTVPPGFQCT
ncbi:14 kDa proline-rich protein DC2.15-like [Malania oleifera]|uniref:14 kDa proline-rich protein DC2.15-like n=1 Tax=Malania oleifera TaxID=397392 RepID=UPI0025AE0459|nr:14 kDa proline-rich protein DC2.15-like [Malania oleifera]